MAWQTSLLSIEGQVRGRSQDWGRIQLSSQDRGYINLNSAQGQGCLLGGRRLACLSQSQGSRVLTAGSWVCLVGDSLFNLLQATCS